MRVPGYSATAPPDPASADVKPSRGLVFLALLAVVALVAALRFAAALLVPVVLAVLISYVLDPPVRLLARARIPRVVGAVVLVVALGGGIAASVYAVWDDATTFMDQLPDAAHRVARLIRPRPGRGPVDKVQQAARELQQATTPQPSRGATRVEVEEPALKVRDYLLSGSLGVVELAAQAGVVMFLALYLLAAGDLFKRKLIRLAGPTLGEKKITLEILREIDRQIGLFMLVRVVVSVIVGVATWLPLELIGLQHAALWGIAAGILNTIPYIGPTVVAVSSALAAFLQFGSAGAAAMVAGVTVAVTSVEGYLLTPWLTSRAAKMNAVAVFLGLVFFGWLWGIWGMFLATPMLMATKAVCDRLEPLQPIGEMLGE